VPVSDAPRCTSAAFVETAWVPWAVCCTLQAISCVAAPCSSTAAAIAEARAAMSWMSASRQIGQDFLMNSSLQRE